METKDQCLISIAEGTHSITLAGAPTHGAALPWQPSPRSLQVCSSLYCDLECTV